MFVPDADFGSRKQTAIVLVGTYKEHGLSDRSVKTVQNGFIITDELAEILYSVSEEISPKKTSGNRAAKKNSKEES